MLAPPLADFLRSRRADCNARFAAARRHWPRLDAADFSLFLRDQLSPLAAALGPAQVNAVLDRAYDLGLQLVAEKLAGPTAVTPAINQLWTEVFPSLGALIGAAPRRILGSLSNAAHHLAAMPDSRPEIWRSRLVALGPCCSTSDELLIVAQLLAWRAGLAHFRASTLAAADALPPELALDALDAPSGAKWSEVRDAHLSDPWYGFNVPATLDRRIGGFRGFGGLFISPPLVACSGSQILVRSGDESWIILADAFGVTLHRATPDEISDALPVSPDPQALDRLPSGHTSTSAVILGATYAVTSGQSHSIWVGPAISNR
jgi:hypothetical protein